MSAKERRLTEAQLREYIEHNRSINLCASTCLEREADLEIARAEAKRAQALAMKFHAGLTAEFHIVPDETIDEATGLIKPKPEPKKA